MSEEVKQPSAAEVERLFHAKYGRTGHLDWGPRTRKFFHYFSPDDWYEAIVEGLVNQDTKWLDVGCGRDIFPSNKELAKRLSQKGSLLVGIDPDETVNENPFVHESINSSIENYEGESEFDLITLRMVAEHISDPDEAVSAIARIAKPGARVIIYTVNKYSPVPILTNLVPFEARHAMKKILWRTEEKDTFPTAYLLNTRRCINKYMSRNGLHEELFLRLDDCRSFARWRVLLIGELTVRTILHSIGLPYPEYCLLGVYRKS